MKTLKKIKQTLQTQKQFLFEKHGVKKIGIFGSYVRGDQTNQSDLDILVDFGDYPGLIEFMSIENELSKMLGLKVDLIMKSGLKPKIGGHILKEAIYI